MNTPVTFTIAKLLKEKGFIEKVKSYNETGELVTVSLAIRRFNLEKIYYPAPTIADVVTWLYEKHGIWINVGRFECFNFCPTISLNFEHKYNLFNEHNSPTEAYIAAIEYTVKHLL